jgi:uncharacterized membrane protein
MIYLFYLAMLAVIGGHFFFAYVQWFKWSKLCEKITDLNIDEIKNTAFLGRSFASYNASIGTGLILSFLLVDKPQVWVQGVILALIALTASVGAAGTSDNTIRNYRLLPAVSALAVLIALQFMAPTVG